MITNFLTDQSINIEFDVEFVYRYSPEYKKGFESRYSKLGHKIHAVHLIDKLRYDKPIDNKILLYIYKIFFSILFIIKKYISIIINTVILTKKFHQIKPDILHINNGGYPAAISCYSAVIASKIIGINHIIYVVNNLAEGYMHSFRWLDYPLDRYMAKNVDYFITGSKFAKERLQEVLHLKPKQTKSINNGVIRRPVSIDSQAFKVKYNIPLERKVFTVIANLEERKGHIFLLKAIKELKNEFSSSELPIFVFEGTGPVESNLSQFINNNNLMDDVLMIGHIEGIFNLINATDVLVLPSIKNEDFPNVIIEAMSLGKAVIGTRFAGIPEQIEHCENGLLVKPRDIDSLKEAIKKLIQEPDLIKGMSMRGKKMFNDKYQVSISTNKYLKVYKSLLN